MSRLLPALKWGGTIVQIVGAFAVSTRVVAPGVGFALMLAGNVAWVIAAHRMREWSMLTCNAVFGLSNLIGLARWVA